LNVSVNPGGLANSPHVVKLGSSSSGDGSVALPAGPDFLRADFHQSGFDLLIKTSDGEQFVAVDYFLSDSPADLTLPAGGTLSAGLVRTLAGPEVSGLYAQTNDTGASDLGLGEPIGSVTEIEGSVFVTHPDGVRLKLAFGDSIFQGDVVASGDNSNVGIVFVDDTMFSLSENGRMTIDEMVFDPGTQDGAFAATVLTGVFSFVSGQVAKTSPDAMVLNTPSGTIGIRGSTGVVKIAGDGSIQVALLRDVNGNLGELVFTNDGGAMVLSQENASTVIAGAKIAPSPVRILTAQEVQQEYGAALNTLTRTIASKAEKDATQDQVKADAAEAKSAAANQDVDAAKQDADAADADAAQAKIDAETAKAEAQAAQAEADALALEAETAATEEAKTAAEEAQIKADAAAQAEADAQIEAEAAKVQAAETEAKVQAAEAEAQAAQDQAQAAQDQASQSAEYSSLATTAAQTQAESFATVVPVAPTPQTQPQETAPADEPAPAQNEDGPAADAAPADTPQDPVPTDPELVDPALAELADPAATAETVIDPVITAALSTTSEEVVVVTDPLTTVTPTPPTTIVIAAPVVSSIITTTTVINNNDPVLTAASISVLEDNEMSGQVTGTDADSDAITFSLSTGPSNGSLSVNADGTFIYAPSANYAGTDSFIIAGSDGNGGIGYSTVSVDVTAVNDAPVVGTNTGVTINLGSTTTLTTAMLNITDVDNIASELLYTLDTATTNGTLSFSGISMGRLAIFSQADLDGGLLSYQHTVQSVAADTFQFTVTDGLGGSLGLTDFIFSISDLAIWTNTGGDGAWATAANWNTSAVPTSTTDVTISSNGLVLTTTTTSNLVNITSGVSVMVNGTSNLSAITENAGTLNISGGNANVLTTTSFTTNSGVINILGSVSWTSSLTVNTGTLTNTGTITTGGAFVYIDTNLTSSGILNFSGPTHLSKVGGTYTSSGSLTVASGQTLYVDGGSSTLTIEKGSTFTNSGTVSVASGSTLTISDAYTNANTISSAGAIVLSGGVTNTGTLTTTGGSLSTTTIVNSGTFSVAGTTTTTTVANSGTFNLNGGSLSGTVTNTGTFYLGASTNASLSISNASGATINATGTSTLAALTDNSGTLAYSAAGGTSITIGAFTTNAGTINMAGSTSYTAALIMDSGTLINTGTITTTTAHSRITTDLTNNGTLTFNGLTYFNKVGGTYVNTSSGSLSIASGQTLFVQGSGTTLDIQAGSTYSNLGTLRIETGATATIVDAQTNSGTLYVNSGTLNLNAALTNTGTVTVTGFGASLSTTTVANSGTMTISAGTTSGVITNTGTLSFAGTSTNTSLTISNANGATLNVSALNTNGTVTVDSVTSNAGSLVYATGRGNTFTADTFATSSGTILMTGSATASTYLKVTSGTFTNSGTITTEVSQRAYINADMTNTGTLNFNTNTYFSKVGGTYSNAGTLNIATGKTLFVEGSGTTLTLQTGTTFNNSGTLSIGSGSTLTMQVAYSGAGALTLAGGTAVLNAAYTVTTGGAITTSSGSILTINGGLTNAGTLTIAASTVSGTMTNTGTIALSGTSTMTGLSLDNQGTLNMAGTVTIGTISSNTGTIDFSGVNGQTLTVTNFTTNAGTINIAAAASWTSKLILTNGMTNTGTITTSATTSANHAIEGNLTNSGTLTLNGDLTFGVSGTTLTNSGTITLAAGKTLLLQNTATLTNDSAGTIVGTGTINASAGTFTNSGTIEAGGIATVGTMAITGDVTNTATSLLRIDVTTLGNDALNISGSATLAGTIDVNFIGGAPVSGTSYTVMSFASSTLGVIKGVSHNLGSDWIVSTTLSGTSMVLTADQGTVLLGTGGVDNFNLSGGFDIFVGAGAADNLTGRTGTDVFRYVAVTDSPTGGGDTISNFEAVGTDIINLQGLMTGHWDGAIIDLGVGGFSNTGTTQIGFNDTSKLLQIDANGDGTADMDITLTGVAIATLDATDFTFV